MSHISHSSVFLKSQSCRTVRRNCSIMLAKTRHCIKPVIGLRLRHAELQAAVRIGFIKLNRLVGVRECQIFPHNVMPKIRIRLIAQDSRILGNFMPKFPDIVKITTEIERTSMNRIQFNTIGSGNIRCPECSIVKVIAEHTRHKAVFPVGRQNALIHVKPILFNGRLFRSVHINAQVTDSLVPGDASPMD